MTLLAAAARRRGPAAPRALYISPHQDDEVLTYGAAILEEVAQGYDVRVLIVTDGSTDITRTYPDLATLIGYTPTVEEFAAARDREFAETVTRLGATPILPPYGTDRIVSREATRANVAALVKEYATPGALLRGTAPTDYHTDHAAVGNAILDLYAEGWGDEPRLMLSAERKTSHAAPGFTSLQMGEPDSVTLYHQWAYREENAAAGWWGIGYRSVPASMDYQINTDGATYWYPPEALA